MLVLFRELARVNTAFKMKTKATGILGKFDDDRFFSNDIISEADALEEDAGILDGNLYPSTFDDVIKEAHKTVRKRNYRIFNYLDLTDRCFLQCSLLVVTHRHCSRALKKFYYKI